MRIPKAFWALALVAALAIPTVLTLPSAEAAGPTSLGRTNWQAFLTPTYVSGITFSPTQHGDTQYYDYAPPIPGDAASGWQNCGAGVVPSNLCTDPNTINMQRVSRLPGCWSWADFTFFQSFVSIPSNATISEFKVVMSGADDGARVSIINSAYPGGFVFAGSYIFLGGAQSTTDLAPYVVTGEVNRVVITQVDDCAVGNNLKFAEITLNGVTVPVQPSADLSLVKTAPSTATAGSNLTYSLTVGNTGPNPASGVVVSDSLPPNVKYVSASGGCTHDGAVSGGVVTCSGISAPVGATVPLTIVVQALAAGPVVNNASITDLGGLLDPNPANNQSSTTTNVTEPPPPPAPPFTIPGTLPVNTANICLPPYMDQDLQTQYWWARAAGGGTLSITLLGVGVNNAESGTVSMKVVDPSSTTVGTVSVSQPPTGEVAAPPVVVAAPGAGALYRIEVKVASPPSGPTARHYRLVLNGATLLGTNSTLQPQAEHEDVRWKVNIGAGEALDIAALPVPEASLNTGTLKLIPPGGGPAAAVVTLTAAGGVASVASPAAGQWTVAMSGMDGHYLLRKTGGADTGIYVAWNSAGSGSATVTVLDSLGGPNTSPVTVELIGPDGSVTSVPGVTGGFSWPKLDTGVYSVRLAGSSTSEPLVVTCDGEAAATLRIPNVLPIAKDDSATTPEDAAVTVSVLANDSDSDGGTLAVTAVTQGANGGVAANLAGTVTYTPAANFNGTDTFTYTISDGQGGNATATVTVTVTPVNDEPVAVDDSATTPEDVAVAVNVTANDSDVDGDTLTVTSVTQGANGTVLIGGNQAAYTPAPNWFGIDTFTYTIVDGNGGTATATVTVTVTSVNDLPVAVDDSASTNAGFPVTVAVLTNDSDSDGGTLSVASTTTPANGTAVVNLDGTVTYTPAAGFSGTDTFTYTISDGQGGTATATVTITVIPVADASRMTGGGSIETGKGKDAKRSTWGFEIRCDGSQGNLQFQDHGGGNFHMEGIISVNCVDDPAVGPGVPKAGFDTLRLKGVGRWNGVSGHTVEATIVDAGEPGTRDTIVITVKNAGGVVVSTLAGSLTGGNHQAHK